MPKLDLSNGVRAHYLISADSGQARTMAEAIALEQSLETAAELIPPEVAEQLLGRVCSVTPLTERRWQVLIDYPMALASGQIGQLLQLLYGNISFYPDVRLIDLHLPAAMLEHLPGPAHGVAGLREACGVSDRSLLMTVLKPRGAPAEQLAEQAAAFVRGGGDLIKDDQNVVESDLMAFTHRVSRCAEAIDAAVQQRGRGAVYFPHVAGSGAHLEAQLEQVKALGLKGVVLCPWIMGLETAAEAARRHELMWLAHPAGAGCWTESPRRGVAASVLLGQLTRLAGADISAFPGQGGRVSLANEGDQRAICQALLKPWGELKATLPCSGGGKRPEQAVEFSQAVGQDCAVMVGSALMMDDRGIERATAETVAALNGTQ